MLHIFRLGEEKESVRGQLLKERKQFESELKRVLQQQERIFHERKGQYIMLPVRLYP